jgi:hypothetical protein
MTNMSMSRYGLLTHVHDMEYLEDFGKNKPHVVFIESYQMSMLKFHVGWEESLVRRSPDDNNMSPFLL